MERAIEQIRAVRLVELVAGNVATAAGASFS
jgi:hypothetical protein